ncbi:MAG: hypothetical protein RQ967_00610 [Candidatus Caldipriscus sp.]|jgi:ribonuclease HII|nr:hypothetical protein [Candidatus Caldipriscus sp.]
MRSGIDEAGLGPKVGSLFVVGVDVEGDLGGIRESKEIFRRNLRGYSVGEGIVISSLYGLGIPHRTAGELFYNLFGWAEGFLYELEIPTFGGKYLDLPFRVIRISARRIPAKNLRKNRFLEDAKAICEIAESLEGREIIAGIAGGFRDYGRFLKGWELDGKFFRKGEKILRFEVSADKNFGEVALASIFAKYFRELEMKALSTLLGFYETIPYFSGYPSDKKTESLIKTLKSLGFEEFIR